VDVVDRSVTPIITCDGPSWLTDAGLIATLRIVTADGDAAARAGARGEADECADQQSHRK
jgi:hypothetical protein